MAAVRAARADLVVDGRGAFTDWYPYPFLDVTELGPGAAIHNAGLVVVLALAFATLFKLADARMPALLGNAPTRMSTRDPA
ncbi:Pr6Pr family membrane protein [Amycolatopsis thermoflava]|uniref:hypothetical protein n=1 Tax=Amycolatopsis thermoflava TaxID=84480 RepID=UPI001ABF30D5|nr:hypothetical protein [Amycolatopsis thermoflava]